jgi:hypothetical protein
MFGVKAPCSVPPPELLGCLPGVLSPLGATLCQCPLNVLAAGRCREDATEAALCLLEVGATVTPVDGAGRTALHAAAEVS